MITLRRISFCLAMVLASSLPAKVEAHARIDKRVQKKAAKQAKKMAKWAAKTKKQAQQVALKYVAKADSTKKHQEAPKQKNHVQPIEQAKLSLQQELVTTKQNLNHVQESEKNNYSTYLLARRDSYNAVAELDSFIAKMQKDNIYIENRTNQKASLTIIVQDKATKRITHVPVAIKAFANYTFRDKKSQIQHVTLQGKGLFINPKWNNSQLFLVIEKTQDRFFLHQHHAFNFKSKPFSEQEIASSSPEEREFKINFNNHRSYMDYIFKEEGMSLESIEQQRESLYARNNIGTLTQNNAAAIDQYEHKIPCITHKIWVTSDENPIEMPQYYIRWYENSIKHNSTDEGWLHYIWIENKNKLPEFAKKLEGHPSIKIMELDKDLPEALITGDTYRQAIKKKQFGKASDILRLEILNQYGGWYLDTDIELYQSLKPYGKVYDMVVALEPMSILIGNALVAARPSHPVILKSLELINRNFSDDAPAYVKNNADEGWKTIVETGPAMLNIAFGKSAGNIGETDIVIPPMMIYPTPVNEYPRKQVIKPNDPKPAESICGHYWETTWMRAEFGSKG